MSLARKSCFYQDYLTVKHILGITGIVFGCLGLIGNIVNIIVLNTRELRSNCFNNLLTSLNVVESLLIISVILDVVRENFAHLFRPLVPAIPHLLYPMKRVSLVASIYIVLSIALERFLAVCRPHQYRQMQGQKNRSLHYILPVVLFSFIINIPKWLDIETREWSACYDYSGCFGTTFVFKEQKIYPMRTELRKDEHYIMFYSSWFWVIVTVIVPFTILSVLSLQIYSTISRLRSRLLHRQGLNGAANANGGGQGRVFRRQETVQHSESKEHNLAVILIFTTATFLLLHTPRCVDSLYEAFTIRAQLHCEAKAHRLEYSKPWRHVTNSIGELFLVLNSSSNIVIYLCVGKTYRTQFNKMFFMEAFEEKWRNVVARIYLTLARTRPRSDENSTEEQNMETFENQTLEMKM